MLDKYHKSHIFKNKLDSKSSYYLAQADITGNYIRSYQYLLPLTLMRFLEMHELHISKELLLSQNLIVFALSDCLQSQSIP